MTNNKTIDDLDFSKVCMEPKEVEYVISHDRCSDGFTSALCAHLYFKKNNLKQPVFFPGIFGRLPPLDDVRDKCVLICDFSYKKPDLKKYLYVIYAPE